jgi:intergrase/recombinase
LREQFNTNAEKVTKKFYSEFKKHLTVFLKFIKGIEDKVSQEWYASLMLNRLMFIYFIQKKGFLDNNLNYLSDKLKETKKNKGDNKFYSFYRNFLLVLFHEGLGAPERPEKLLKEIGKVPYLNGGLFEVHQIEKEYKKIEIEDKAF